MSHDHLTTTMVRVAVETIARDYRTTGDYESAHAAEDTLFGLVLGAIAGGGCDDAAGCAREAIRSREFDFPRYCA